MINKHIYPEEAIECIQNHYNQMINTYDMIVEIGCRKPKNSIQTMNTLKNVLNDIVSEVIEKLNDMHFPSM